MKFEDQPFPPYNIEEDVVYIYGYLYWLFCFVTYGNYFCFPLYQSIKLVLITYLINIRFAKLFLSFYFFP